MYRPRRTTEFHVDANEDGSVPIKRQTRSLMRSTATPNKRPSSVQRQTQQRGILNNQERDRETPLRSLSKRSAANVNVTPLRARGASSVERPAALHTDKKWVQEQSQQIAEYLNEMVQMHALQGFSSEFFARGGASLRQITIKQFVAIVNFFFQNIWRHRVSVGSNHVEDMTNALQKLKYPYQVNKSWLLTPTTQHSFGHVIVMLDFLKDIAAPPITYDGEHEFPFMETGEHLNHLGTTLEKSAQSSSTNDFTVMLNENTNYLLFANATECFAVWDKQEWQEYAKLQRKVSNQIVKQLCDLPDVEALNADLTSQQSELQKLDKQLQSIDGSKFEQLEQLKEQQQKLEKQLLSTQTNLNIQNEQITELCDRGAQNTKILHLEANQRKQLQCTVDKQKPMAEKYQRTKLLLADIKNEEQVHKRQLRNLVERSDNQQVQLSRAKKQLLNQVESFNKHAQNISLDPVIFSVSEKVQLELMLSLPLQDSDIQARISTFKELVALLDQRCTEHIERQSQLERKMAERTLQNRNHDAEHNIIDAQIQSNKDQLAKLNQSYKTQCSMWSQHQQQILERNNCLLAELEQLQKQHTELALILQNNRQQIEDFLSDAERRQKENLCVRTTNIMEFQKNQTKMEEELVEIKNVIAQNEIKLCDLRIELAKNVLPSYEDELVKDFENANF